MSERGGCRVGTQQGGTKGEPLPPSPPELLAGASPVCCAVPGEAAGCCWGGWCDKEWHCAGWAEVQGIKRGKHGTGAGEEQGMAEPLSAPPARHVPCSGQAKRHCFLLN